MLEICPPHDCTGCTACASICSSGAISMIPDEWGFPHPSIDQSLCTDCGACKKVCPALNEPQRTGRLDPEEFYAAYHKDESIRMSSSSGGAFSALASAVLKNGGIVCGASFDEEFRRVNHIIIDHEEGMKLLRTSKYTQSFMGDCFKEIKKLLKEGKQVLFSGTPCQTAGLHLYLRRDYPQLITIDIVCHGVPSPVIFNDYISFLNDKFQSPVSNYTFRDKKWSWYRFNMKAEMASGETYYGTWEGDPYFRGFLNDYFLRECCYTCRFSKHYRYADITLSDFWGYDRADGGFIDDDKGISMCMCSTQKGASLLNEAKNELIWCPRPKEMSLSNGGFNPREQTTEGRKQFLSHYRELGFKKSIEPYFSPVPIEEKFQKIYSSGRLTWSTYIDAILVVGITGNDSEQSQFLESIQPLAPQEKIHYFSATEKTLSFAKAIRHALSHPEWNTILVINNDTLIDEKALLDSTYLLNAFIENNSSWDMIYLGWDQMPQHVAPSLKPDNTSLFIGRADRVSGTFASLINRRALATISKKLPDESNIHQWVRRNVSLDYWFKNHFAPFAQVYVLSPSIIRRETHTEQITDLSYPAIDPETCKLSEKELERILKRAAPMKKFQIRIRRILRLIFRI